MNYAELYHRNNETLLGADTGPQEALEHHGIPGQKWGVRRFQYADGSLTKAGQIRYGYGTKAVKKRSEQESESHNQYKSAHSR